MFVVVAITIELVGVAISMPLTDISESGKGVALF